MKLKKTITAVVVFAVMCCSALFAAEAKKSSKSSQSTNGLGFTVTPAIGLSVTSSTGNVFGTSIRYSLIQFDMGVHAAMLGIPGVSKDSWLSNLTPMINIDLGIAGKLSSEGGSVKTGGALFHMSALCGYTFKPIKNLYITPAAGLGFSAGSITLKAEGIELERFRTGAFSLPLYAGLKYFFTDLIGIELTLIDTLNFGTVLTSPWGSFQNTFIIKVGPSFRF